MVDSIVERAVVDKVSARLCIVYPTRTKFSPVSTRALSSQSLTSSSLSDCRWPSKHSLTISSFTFM